MVTSGVSAQVCLGPRTRVLDTTVVTRGPVVLATLSYLLKDTHSPKHFVETSREGNGIDRNPDPANTSKNLTKQCNRKIEITTEYRSSVSTGERD